MVTLNSMIRQNLKFFRGSLIVTLVGLALAAAIGFYYHGTISGALQYFVLALILGVLEVSISFDNAVVNATVLKDMTHLWQKRFLTWGMVIAVFGMRLFFPLLIVAFVAHVGPFEAFRLALFSPDQYAQIMLSVHHEVAAFGGSFLMLVALKYFFNHEKEIHWIKMIEGPLSAMGKLEAIEVGVVLAVIYGVSRWVPEAETLSVIYSGIAGVLTFLAVEGLSVFLRVPAGHGLDAHRASLGMFLYLEVLDASFSFDGVVGAFAITNNLLIISLGLGIGAMFVRSLTIMMVEKGTLQAFRYLEHGAFYAVAALSGIMFLNTIVHVPEIMTGFIRVTLIALSIYASPRIPTGS